MSRRRYDVEVSEKARGMLLEHACFISRVNERAAEEFFDLFEENIAALEEMPERFPPYDNPYIQYGKYRKLMLGRHHLIIFQVSGDKVFIELVLDSRAENKPE
jgi:plasmid stabilization system protein ParE